MFPQKRKQTAANEVFFYMGNSAVDKADSDHEVDIASALTRKNDPAGENSDDELARIIQNSIARRDVKAGTEVLKQVKGKAKMGKGEVGGGSFQCMGLHPPLLRSLTLQGYRIPTPIQRLSIPVLLANPPRDLVGMARTGSGKSLAYMIPLVQRLGGRHTTTFGARALVLLPTRELALQVLKVGKELVRGWHVGQGDHAGDSKDAYSAKGQSLRWGLVVGGEALDEQFETIVNNPDIIIATPGRLLHLIVEMNLDLKSVQYMVFDEADRLFEMGFEVALNEILHQLPLTRQTILFSATLPKSLVEFAKAGLQNPKLVRLDAESKISSDLKMAFFSVKQAEKDACLLSLLRDVIQVPLGTAPQQAEDDEKRKGKYHDQSTASHQTLVFAATKHHVEYLQNLLKTAGYAVSHIYGSLDQTARSFQMDQFRRGLSSILVVTDVAARGIDIPVLENVVNYDFPQGARVFVHRVGRTARAGRQGWAWSFVTPTELPYLLDLELFLDRPLRGNVSEDGDQVYTESLILGTFEREKIDEDVEYVRSLEDVNHALPLLREVMKRGHAMYERSRGKASPKNYKRAKEMLKDPKWILTGSDWGVHPVILRGRDGPQRWQKEKARNALLRAVNSFKPVETVFEAGIKGNMANAVLMKERRKALGKAAQRAAQGPTPAAAVNGEVLEANTGTSDVEMADEDDLAAVFGTSSKRPGKEGYRDSQFYLSYYQKDAMTEKGYSLIDGASSFAEQARGVAFDLAGDEGTAADRKQRQLHWDKKKKKFIKGDGVGSDNVKLVKTENGTRLPATYRSGRFDEWKATNHVSLPNAGEAENEARRGKRLSGGPGGPTFKHNKVVAAKPLHKLNKDYQRKTRLMRKKAEGAGNDARSPSSAATKVGGRYRGKPMERVKTELKTAEQIRKRRKMLDKRKAKNGRTTRGKKGR